MIRTMTDARPNSPPIRPWLLGLALTALTMTVYLPALHGGQSALAEYEQAVRINFGNTLLVAGQNEAAVAQYEKALRLAPDSYVAHFNLGNALLHMGRKQDAIAHFEEVLRLKPGFAPAERKLAQLLSTP